VAVAAKWLMGDINEKLTGCDRGGRDRGPMERLSLDYLLERLSDQCTDLFCVAAATKKRLPGNAKDLSNDNPTV
jgi:hypothetical protein